MTFGWWVGHNNNFYQGASPFLHPISSRFVCHWVKLLSKQNYYYHTIPYVLAFAISSHIRMFVLWVHIDNWSRKKSIEQIQTQFVSDLASITGLWAYTRTLEPYLPFLNKRRPFSFVFINLHIFHRYRQKSFCRHFILCVWHKSVNHTRRVKR